MQDGCAYQCDGELGESNPITIACLAKGRLDGRSQSESDHDAVGLETERWRITQSRAANYEDGGASDTLHLIKTIRVMSKRLDNFHFC